MSEGKTVSVITPCWNGEKFVGRFLDSLLSQTYAGSIELLIVDDGSTDHTVDVIKSYAPKFSSKNYILRYFYKENGGAASAINQALDKFTGDYVTWFDSDDFMTPDSLEKRVRFLEDNPQYDFCICQLAWVSEAEPLKVIKIQKRIPPPPEQDRLFEDIIFERNHIWQNVYLVRRAAFLKAHPTLHIYESREGQNAQLILPIAYHCRLGYVNEPLCAYVLRDSSHSHQKRNTKQLAARNDGLCDIHYNTIQSIRMPDSVKGHWINVVLQKYKHRNLVLGIKNNEPTIIQECLEFHARTGLNIFGSDIFEVLPLLKNYILPTIKMKNALRSSLSEIK